MQFPFKLDKFQLDSIDSINGGNNVLACIGTGSGKTVIAKYAISYFLNQGKKVIYTSPIKSLSNQKYAEFKKDFPDLNLGIMTGDIKFNPDADCVIMTTEILRNMLYKEDSLNLNLGCVIFDEVHYINNPERGKVWEESIILLPEDITMVMLSATIKNPEKFANWLNAIKKKKTDLIIKEDRVIPLTHYFYNQNKENEEKETLIEILSSNNVFNGKNYDLILSNFNSNLKKSIKPNYKSLLNPFTTFLKTRNLLPALFFSFSRKNCELYGSSIHISLIDHLEQAQITKIFDTKMHSLDTKYDHMNQYHNTKELLLKGIGVHHSGLIPVLKEIIEILFSKGLIKVLFATETFAVGVNMPTKTVIFTELSKFDDNGLRNLRTDEYMQMAGRAGRRGLDTIGTVIHLNLRNDLLDKNEIKNIMLGSMPEIISKFKLSYQFLLKSIYYKEEGKSIMNFIRNTLLDSENNIDAKNSIVKKEKIIEKLKLLKYDEDTLIDFIKTYKMANIDLIKPKQKKQLNKKLAMFNPIYETIFKYKNEIDQIDNDIHYQTGYIQQTIINMIKMLIECGYLNDNDNYLYMDKTNITVKGLIAMEVNECNELIFTEIIYNGLLDKLDLTDIIGIIACFVSEREKDGEKGKNKMQMDDKILVQVKEISSKLENIEYNNWITIDTDWMINTAFIEPAYMWGQGESILEIYKKIDIYEGNFIKNIIKINKICENIISICKILQNDGLCKKVMQIEQILIRDIVNVESLYIK
jgi:superfamily II RNA helicase